MKRNLLVASIVSLALAGLLFLFNIMRLEVMVGRVNVSVLPAAFFALLGVVLFYLATRERQRR